MKKNYALLLVLFCWGMLSSCQHDLVQKKNPATDQEPKAIHILGSLDIPVSMMQVLDTTAAKDQMAARTTGFVDWFENDYVGSYSGGSLNFYSGTWYLSDALTGNLSSDRKDGSQSIRIRNSGYAIMDFDMDNGVSAVSVDHAKFGSDGNSDWRLIASYDGGNNWYYVSNSVTTNSTSLHKVTFTLDITQPVRLGVYKVSGGGNRINIDNFEITTSSNSGGSTGGGSTGGGGTPDPANATRDNNLTFGNPSNAGTANDNNYLVSRNEYALSYDNALGRSLWVSWHLSAAWLGSVSRSNDFRADDALPSYFYKAVHSSYTNSGFDRGHLCPSGDRTYSSTANSNTFYMTNIEPQGPKNNQQTWRYLEEYERTLANQGYELYIIAGTYGKGGDARNGYADYIDNGNIEVPSHFWKVLLVLPNGTNDLSRVDSNTRIIAVDMPNSESISTSWGQYRVSVDDIEANTGLDLYSNLDNTLEATLESQVDNGPTQ